MIQRQVEDGHVLRKYLGTLDKTQGRNLEAERS